MTPEELNNSIILCFLEVQKDNLAELMGSHKTIDQEKEYALKFTKRAFFETGGNFNKPTKQDYLSALKWLMETCPAPKDIKKATIHRKKIIEMVSSLNE